jgi:hypothetical protein
MDDGPAAPPLPVPQPSEEAPMEGTRPGPEPSLADPPLLVADEDGIRVVEQGVVTHRFLTEPASLAVPDLSGGVVFQHLVHDATDLAWDDAAGRHVLVWDDGGPDPILWIRAEGAAPEEIVSHPDARLRLVDVAMIDARPHALYRSLIGGPATMDAANWDLVLEWLALYDLERGETTVLGLIGSFESSFTELRIGGGLVAVTFHPYADGGASIGWMPVRELVAETEEDWLPALAQEHLTHHATDRCPSTQLYCEGWAIATAASDGSRLVWVQGGHQVDEDSTVVAWPMEVAPVDAASGAETPRVDLGAISLPGASPDERPTAIDADGSFVVVSRVGPDRAVVLVLPDGEVRAVGLEGATAMLWEEGS